ncbi:MAG: hypothetical protein H6R06_2171 [Proteobacteria bacterium]|jgi:hypothetical protein|nr:hypothetical protein [Pseudomonadota bacterium]
MARTLFTNAKLVLDGFDTLQAGQELLVEDGSIRAVSAGPLPRSAGRRWSTRASARSCPG